MVLSFVTFKVEFVTTVEGWSLLARKRCVQHSNRCVHNQGTTSEEGSYLRLIALCITQL